MHSRAGQNWDGLKRHVWSLHSNSATTFPLLSTENHFAYLNHITKWLVLEMKTQKNLSSAVKHSWITQGRSFSKESLSLYLEELVNNHPTLLNIKHFSAIVPPCFLWQEHPKNREVTSVTTEKASSNATPKLGYHEDYTCELPGPVFCLWKAKNGAYWGWMIFINNTGIQQHSVKPLLLITKSYLLSLKDFLFNLLCVQMFWRVHISAGAWESLRHWIPVELESQMVVSTWHGA